MTSIPLADAAALRPAARRTLGIRIALAAALAGLIVAVVVASRHPHTQTIVTLPAHSSAIVVLDVSASISSDTYSRIGATLQSLARSGGGRYGLIVFSDQAYEALPPGTPAQDLAPLVRYFTLQEKRGGFAQTFPPNPWAKTFSAGTKISAGLELADRIAFEDKLSKAAVILVSDLDDDPEDLGRLVTITLALKRDGIPLRIVGLNPSTQDVALFKRLTGGARIVRAGLLQPGPEPKNHTPFPWTLVALALVVTVGIAAHELWGPRLEWRTEP